MTTAPVVMPAMSEAQTDAWYALFDLHERLPRGWTLVGGQMVHLHCTERDTLPVRPTEDADTILDVRAEPAMLTLFTRCLLGLGFTPDTSGEGVQHRWNRGRTQIDVLLPEGIPERLAARAGAGGGPTITTPGGTQALGRTQPVNVRVRRRTGAVHRPSLVGALVIKAAAHTLPEGGFAKARHRLDFVVLAELLSRSDLVGEQLNKRDRRRLTDMVAACRADQVLMGRSGAGTGLARLERAAHLV
ncbi:MAG: hypothetical protein ACRCY8_18650 [Dermatophilaceae bacterium]